MLSQLACLLCLAQPSGAVAPVADSLAIGLPLRPQPLFVSATEGSLPNPGASAEPAAPELAPISLEGKSKAAAGLSMVGLAAAAGFSAYAAHRQGFSAGRIAWDWGAASAGMSAGSLPGLYLMMGHAVPASTDTGSGSWTASMTLAAGGAWLGGIGGLAAAEWLQGQPPTLEAAATASAGLLAGGLVSYLGLWLGQQTGWEVPTMLLAAAVLGATTVAGWSMGR